MHAAYLYQIQDTKFLIIGHLPLEQSLRRHAESCTRRGYTGTR